jgi:hypothetical protein
MSLLYLLAFPPPLFYDPFLKMESLLHHNNPYYRQQVPKQQTEQQLQKQT